MSLLNNPFGKSTAIPGKGDIVLAVLPPGRQVLKTFTYRYPLKLIAPDPHTVGEAQHVTTVFLLTYGGGLVGGDGINLTVELQDSSRLGLLTQGSTKIFKSPSPSVVTRQILDVKIGKGAALCYLPDPNQPFAESVYEQRQTFYVDPCGSSNLLMLDWVSEGRKARGESWTLWSWKGRNEVREFDETSKGRLLIRDAILLHEGDLGQGLASKTNSMGILGTLIIYGSMFKHLGDFFMKEFTAQPRIGAKSWTSRSGDALVGHTEESQAKARAEQEQKDGLLWTAAQIRGFVLVKFGARDLDSARRWLYQLLKKEATVEREFGHQALLCLR